MELQSISPAATVTNNKIKYCAHHTALGITLHREVLWIAHLILTHAHTNVILQHQACTDQGQLYPHHHLPHTCVSSYITLLLY